MKTNYFKTKLEKNKITIKQILVLFDKTKFLFLYFINTIPTNIFIFKNFFLFVLTRIHNMRFML